MAALIALLIWMRGGAALTREPVKFSFVPPGAATLVENGIASTALSPDGRRIAFIAREASGITAIWVRSLESDEPQRVAGSEGASSPFWSPDGQFLAYFGDGKLRKIALAGGPPQNICNSAPGLGGTWSQSGDIVFNPTNRAPLMRVSASGGAPRPLTTLDPGRGENSHRCPSFLPDARHVLF